MQTKFSRYLITGLFILYLLVLVKLVLLKGPLFFEVVSGSSSYKKEMQQRTLRQVNLVPFRTIKAFVNPHPSTGPSTRFFNLFGNVLLFMPLGFLLPLVVRRAGRFWQVLIASAGVSLLFELIQLAAGIGWFDVDDLLLNTVGGVLGFLLLQLVRVLLLQHAPRAGRGR